MHKRRGPSTIAYASNKAQKNAIWKGKELQTTLGPQGLPIVKTVLPSHVSGGSWLVNEIRCLQLYFSEVGISFSG